MRERSLNQGGVKPATAHGIEFNMKVKGDGDAVLHSLGHLFGETVFHGGKEEQVTVRCGYNDVHQLRFFFLLCQKRLRQKDKQGYQVDRNMYEIFHCLYSAPEKRCVT